jgi:hypothetical protein
MFSFIFFILATDFVNQCKWVWYKLHQLCTVMVVGRGGMMRGRWTCSNNFLLLKNLDEIILYIMMFIDIKCIHKISFSDARYDTSVSNHWLYLTCDGYLIQYLKVTKRKVFFTLRKISNKRSCKHFNKAACIKCQHQPSHWQNRY